LVVVKVKGLGDKMEWANLSEKGEAGGGKHPTFPAAGPENRSYLKVPIAFSTQVKIVCQPKCLLTFSSLSESQKAA
jgi:hypothetical protein